MNGRAEARPNVLLRFSHHVEITPDRRVRRDHEPKRAKAFSATTLGLRLVSEDGFALMFDAGGTMLRVAIVKMLVPAGYTVLGIVPDTAKAVRGLVKRGVVFQRDDGMPQDELEILSSPSGARVAWFSDPDRNTLSLTELPRATRKRGA